MVRVNIYSSVVKKNFKNLDKVVTLITQMAAEECVERAKDIVHIDTGALIDSIGIRSIKDTKHGQSYIVAAGGLGTTLNFSEQDYAAYHEFGGRWFNGKPTPRVLYMSKALESMKRDDYFGVTFVNLAKRYIKQHGGNYPL